jgi:hypothetical protein
MRNLVRGSSGPVTQQQRWDVEHDTRQRRPPTDLLLRVDEREDARARGGHVRDGREHAVDAGHLHASHGGADTQREQRVGDVTPQ